MVVQTDRHNMLVYSIPHLEYLHTVQLPSASLCVIFFFSITESTVISSSTNRPLTIDASGDFIAWSTDPVSKLVNSATYGTFFNFRRANTLPDVDFSTSRGRIPSQPQPVSLGPTSFLGSWFSFNQTKTGDQIDDLCVFVLFLLLLLLISLPKWAGLIDLSLRRYLSEAMVGHLKGLLVQRRVPLRIWLPVSPQFNQAYTVDSLLR